MILSDTKTTQSNFEVGSRRRAQDSIPQATLASALFDVRLHNDRGTLSSWSYNLHSAQPSTIVD